MAAPLGAVWLTDERRYRTEDEQTEGLVPTNTWMYSCAIMVPPLLCPHAAAQRPTALLATWQARVKKGATKPRNAPWPVETLSFHQGEVARCVDMLAPNAAFSLRRSELPKGTKAVFAQLQHAMVGGEAWMRSFEDVKAAFIDEYRAGNISPEFTAQMTTSTFSAPWPAAGDSLCCLEADMGAPPPTPKPRP